MAAQPLKIVDVPEDVDAQLEALGMSREFVKHVAQQAAGARLEALPIDPVGSAGWDSYRYGTRAIRMGLLASGWRVAREGNVEATVNDDLNVQVVFQNVNRACASQDPEAISGKGAGARSLVNRGQGVLFGKSETGFQHGASPTVWLICVSADETSLRAEVSCPESFEGNQFEGFSRRLFVIDETFDGPVDWGSDDDVGDGGDLPDVPVTKK